MLGLGNTLGSGIVTPGIVTDSLVMKHKYPVGAVQPLSDGAAYFVAANDDNIDITATTLLTNSGNVSIMFWWKYNGAGASPWAVLGHTAEANERHLRFVGTDDLKLEGDTASDEAVISLNTAFTDAQWHHYAIICTSGTAACFQDGASCSIAAAGMSSDMPINLIGAQYNTTNNYNLDGYICNLGIWSRACTQAEIKSIMWKRYIGLTSSESNLLTSWWALDTDASDSTGTNDGALD
jgi:hypothetical protein